tara:strand:+ start:135 stop:1031 length:897 start_codon:yes stop_codon:yes gene_type:complete
MKRYNYWNYVKTGGWQISHNFLHNRKIVCVNHHSQPAFSILFTPSGIERYNKTWYYQRNGKLEKISKSKDYSTYEKVMEDCFPAHRKWEWFYESPFISSRGDYNMKIWGKDNIDKIPITYYAAYAAISVAQVTCNPHVMLGYYGSTGIDNDITSDLENMTPPYPPAAVIRDEIISDYKKKINIVPYKEDIVSLVEDFIHGVLGSAYMKHGEDYFIEACVHKLKNHKKTYHLITSMLEYQGIDYIPFNLDRDNYSDVFDLDTWLPLDKIKKDQSNRYKTMPDKKLKKLPQYIDKVLCLI